MQFLKILIVSLLFSIPVFSKGGDGLLYADVYGMYGYGSLEVNGESKSPSMGTMALGVTLAMNFSPLLIGLQADYRNIVQYTAPSEISDQNRAGTRLNGVAPMVGLRFDRLLIKAYYQMMGDHEFSKKTSTGEQVSYTDPSGYGASVNYLITENVYIGLLMDIVTYKKTKVGSVETDLSATNNEVTHTSNGIQLGYVF